MPDSDPLPSAPTDYLQWVDHLPSPPSELKRVSLDATETWHSESAEDVLLEWPDEEQPLAVEEGRLLMDPPPPPEPHPLDMNLLMDLDEDNDDETPESLQARFAHQRAVLHESMQRSRRSRPWLESHIEQRANLAGVLRDIHRSSAQVAQLLSTEDRQVLEATALELLPDSLVEEVAAMDADVP